MYPIWTALDEWESLLLGLYENKNRDKKVSNPLKISLICVWLCVTFWFIIVEIKKLNPGNLVKELTKTTEN